MSKSVFWVVMPPSSVLKIEVKCLSEMLVFTVLQPRRPVSVYGKTFLGAVRL